MNVAEQVCTIKQGRRLYELGLTEAKGIFCYCYVSMSLSEEGYYEILPTTFDLKIPDLATTWECDLFTVAELTKMLPHNPVPDGGISYSFYHRYNWRGHSVGYSAPAQPDKHIQRPWFENEAEAKADLLIHLIEKYSYPIEKASQSLKS